MTEKKNIYDGISKIAWGYIFLYFDINLGAVSLMPDFVGYILFHGAIKLMEEEERDLALLRPLGILLGLWRGAEWLLSWAGSDLSALPLFLHLLISLASIYFDFQLLTNLASIAGKYQPEGGEFDTKLLKFRTTQAVTLTAMTLIGQLSDWFGDAAAYAALVVGLAHLIVWLRIIKALFGLQRCLGEMHDLN